MGLQRADRIIHHVLWKHRNRTPEGPTGEKLGIAVQATGRLAKAASETGGERMREWVGPGSQKSGLLRGENAFRLFQEGLH